MTGKSDEKTIPFLRRLVEMLRDNEDAISFVPGSRTGSKKTVGRIVIHDRITVESEILPKYFNHASFASLRRQLNYFHFVRVGKGRQRGATYRNDAVYVMDDILRLKRRSAGEHEAAAAALALAAEGAVEEESVSESPSTSTSNSIPRKIKSSSKNNEDDAADADSTSRPTVVSPSLSMESSDEDDQEMGNEDASAPSATTKTSKKAGKKNKTPTIVLDLTKPPEGPLLDHYNFGSAYGDYRYPAAAPITVPRPTHGFTFQPVFQPITPPAPSAEEVLEGCEALLALNCQPVVRNKTRQVTA